MKKGKLLGKQSRHDGTLVYAGYSDEHVKILVHKIDKEYWDEIVISIDEVDPLISWLEQAKRIHVAEMEEAADAEMLGHILSGNPN